MPAADHSLALRGAIMVRLKASPGVVSMVPADRIRVEQPPGDMEWPWIKWGLPIYVADESSGLAGGEYSLTIHAFGVDSTQTHQLARRIQAALDEQQLPLVPEAEDDTTRPPFLIELRHEGTDLVGDAGRVGGYHAIVRFSAVTAEEAAL